MQCKGFQYEVGKTYTHDGKVELCKTGFHFCEHPLDVLSYYPLKDGNRWASVNAQGVSDEKEKDSKRVSSVLAIKAELTLKSLIDCAVKFTMNLAKSVPSDYYAHSATSGYYAHSATSGDSAHSATSGYSAHSATSGYSAHSATSGDSAHSATSGDSAHSATSGYSAHSATSGYYAHSATSGDSAHSATSGDSAHSATSGYYANSATSGDSAHSSALGKESIAAAIGRGSMAKAAKGNWIVLAEYTEDRAVRWVKTAKVDGKKLKADTFYTLKEGKFVEVEA
jgi:hypothetical protein